jgi:hypothetical protein
MIEELVHGNLLAKNKRLPERVEELEEENRKLNDTCMALQEENWCLFKVLQLRDDYY